MAHCSEDVLTITSLISSAALDRSRWQDVTDHLHDMSGGVQTHLLGVDLQANIDLGNISAGYDPGWQESYHQHFFALNVWAEGFSRIAVGTPLSSEMACSLDRLVQTEFYHDWLKPQEDISGGGGVVLFRDPSRMFLFGGNIRRKDVARLEDDWMRLVGFLVPHVTNAFEINRALARNSLDAFAMQDNRGDGSTGVFLINAHRLVLMANDAGERMIADRSMVRTDLLGRFSIAGTGQSGYEKAISASATTEVFFPRVFDLQDMSGQTRYLCRTAAVGQSGLAGSPLQTVLGPDESAMIVIISPMTGVPDLEKAIAAQYGLTPQEARIAAKAAEGMTAREIADRHQTAMNTVRSQIKSILSKLGVHRQADIVRIVQTHRANFR